MFEMAWRRAARRSRILAEEFFGIVFCDKKRRCLSPALYGFMLGAMWLLACHEGLEWRVGPTVILWAGLLVIFLADARYFMIPDGPVAAIAVCGMIVHGQEAWSLQAMYVASAMAGYGMFRGFAWLYERGWGEQGLGEGDAAIFAAAGLWVGLEGLAGVLLIAVASAGVAAAIGGQERGLADGCRRIPFGPHLGLGLWLTWAVGPIIFG